jgi:hypothetical protein
MLWQRYRDRGLSVIAVEATGAREAAQKVIRDFGLTFHLLENGRGREEFVERLFTVFSYPTLLVIDVDGHVIGRHVGFRPGDEKSLETLVKKMLDGEHLHLSVSEQAVEEQTDAPH